MSAVKDLAQSILDLQCGDPGGKDAQVRALCKEALAVKEPAVSTRKTKKDAKTND